ncbi:MAG: hypothetical protein J6W82_06435 [Bacteroidales bacterium]|nr:hypothetical protein [Bacteroidales bacterium]
MKKLIHSAPDGVGASPFPAYVRPCAEETFLIYRSLLCESLDSDFDDIVDDTFNV